MTLDKLAKLINKPINFLRATLPWRKSMYIEKGSTYTIRPGDHFNLLLPCGTLLNVEQTQDDFSIVRGNGIVAYEKATSNSGIKIDEEDRKTGENPTPTEQTTGFN